MLQSAQPLYPAELSQLLVATAARLDAQPVERKASRVDAIQKARMYECALVMPLEFQLMHHRQVRWSSWFNLPDGTGMHLVGARMPRQAKSYRIESMTPSVDYILTP